jgi:hypothetical protein
VVGCTCSHWVWCKYVVILSSHCAISTRNHNPLSATIELVVRSCFCVVSEQMKCVELLSTGKPFRAAQYNNLLDFVTYQCNGSFEARPYYSTAPPESVARCTGFSFTVKVGTNRRIRRRLEATSRVRRRGGGGGGG